ncbi:Rrf2 family transcriptional regulator [Blautia liquoris]|uniref:Rrf2 family transcriptional regulator n=1 Tax=Blautia liquoris TaxID=2779518 RepID=A0A7M2RL44_9FIRM|nr:Rrf2 family transcriptional regulator [Blautia liquoris]QOV20858.1 Rrf2 family transcriptional regulator [Blautia liquoris]
MLITREVDYAVRILRALADNKIISVREMCSREDISVSIAYKITRKLEKAGVIQSYRGTNGGYALKKSLDDITLYDVIEIVDKELLITECLQDEYNCSRNTKSDICKLHQEFYRVQEILTGELQSKSLSAVFSMS